MFYITIHNCSRPLSTPLKVRYCQSFACRLKGLSFRRSLSRGEGLLLVQGREDRLDAAIHMFFMWFDLAVVWIDDQKNVVDVKLARRWRPFYVPAKPARYVLEVTTSWLNEFKIGDVLDFEETG